MHLICIVQAVLWFNCRLQHKSEMTSLLCVMREIKSFIVALNDTKRCHQTVTKEHFSYYRTLQHLNISTTPAAAPVPSKKESKATEKAGSVSSASLGQQTTGQVSCRFYCLLIPGIVMACITNPPGM